mmetsp:Transcript_17838/g.69163  ORF Transcript_17838/g.69163 Transcript_17838/m.69163 type:complete len:430 (+) Transcript_17838:123-1412(+)|eukprot:CAMPEP_0114615656 /NCGR_PEP_ID=MMETSP0168-20121206/6279_1 /TAXON_ID=95228 ORGANISM="Vannella sp., Strain DIVA3 517/6/12" /NCGR_SAMPLE_ID=MMETSP0168 /ASSEMBLY_ACC=CAM_ASM_000044 /LENGTH=429 /DNA_ID=CAMNT_0001826737 /DNA_START=97 /DNA_END=1386 /DNA_ORIENTATION=-
MSAIDEDNFDDLADYEEEEDEVVNKDEQKTTDKGDRDVYTSVHTTSFDDLLLLPELVRAISNCGFEHPSEVQNECIPTAIMGTDALCQAKSGMGKTAVFVISVLQQIYPVETEGIKALVLCHCRELAYQITNEFERFKKYLEGVRVACLYGGVPIKQHKELLKTTPPHIVVATPGRCKHLIETGDLDLSKLKHFILDECDRMLESLDMRQDVQEIFRKTPHDKQVMMFSATLNDEIRPICKKFMQNPLEIYVTDGSKLTLHGLVQYHVSLRENEKNRKLFNILDAIQFNQVVIFVNKRTRAEALSKLLVKGNFPAITVHRDMAQEERIARYKKFKEFRTRIMVSTDMFGRGIDIAKVNVVINYDMPDSADSYLHRVGRAGRFGTKGLAISFVSSEGDADVLNQVQSRFRVPIPEMPEEIDCSVYMNVTN